MARLRPQPRLAPAEARSGCPGPNAVPGQVEKRLDSAAKVWQRRCQGATYATLAAEFGISKDLRPSAFIPSSVGRGLAARSRGRGICHYTSCRQRNPGRKMLHRIPQFVGAFIAVPLLA